MTSAAPEPLVAAGDDLATPPDRRSHPRRAVMKVLRAALVAAMVLVPTGVVLALRLSVVVDGHSMEPSLAPDDRLLVDAFHGGAGAHRFDLVAVTVPGVGVVVKRVVGLPGDTIRVSATDGGPEVLVRRAGSSTDLLVDNPAWPGQARGDTAVCCTAAGKTSVRPTDSVVPVGQYWVIGDNWGNSEDSRIFGFVTASQIRATLNLRILPLSAFGRVPSAVTLRPRATG